MTFEVLCLDKWQAVCLDKGQMTPYFYLFFITKVKHVYGLSEKADKQKED